VFKQNKGLKKWFKESKGLKKLFKQNKGLIGIELDVYLVDIQYLSILSTVTTGVKEET